MADKTGMVLTGNWTGFYKRLKALPRRIRDELRDVGHGVGTLLVDEIHAGLKSQAPGGQAFDPLNPYTVWQKGSNLALTGGDMEKSLHYEIRTGGLEVWVGVGAEHAMVAKIQQRGITIDVTEKMRAYLAANGLHLRVSTTAIVIPPRPFIGPAIRAARPAVRERYRRALKKAFESR
jgi:hypothetical protein